jgi:hypothetical protein
MKSPNQKDKTEIESIQWKRAAGCLHLLGAPQTRAFAEKYDFV